MKINKLEFIAELLLLFFLVFYIVRLGYLYDTPKEETIIKITENGPTYPLPCTGRFNNELSVLGDESGCYDLYFYKIEKLEQAFKNHIELENNPPEKLKYTHKDGYEVEYVSDVWSEDFGNWCGHKECTEWLNGACWQDTLMCFTEQEIKEGLEVKFK